MDHFKKTILMQNLIKNIHQDAPNCTFFQNCFAGEHALSMCAADIIIVI